MPGAATSLQQGQTDCCWLFVSVIIHLAIRMAAEFSSVGGGWLGIFFGGWRQDNAIYGLNRRVDSRIKGRLMKILLLAPQPFFIERGTPIAVKCLVRVLLARGWEVDLLAFHEGQELRYPRLNIVRTPALRWVRNIPPGLSVKKLVCDVFFFFKAAGLVLRNRYDYIHAVEESVFMALFFNIFSGVPFVYDMDSSMSEQIGASHRGLRFILPLLRWFESVALRRALVVLPVCDALDGVARRCGVEKSIILRDPPAFEVNAGLDPAAGRKELAIDGVCFMYIGNLESYQGIDLMLNGFAGALARGVRACLLVVGGGRGDIEKYQAVCRAMRIQDKVRFLGPRPVDSVGDLVALADVLVSPRAAGVNTPMKIYAYLNSGRAILATEILSHTQVLGPETALLVAPDEAAFADGVVRLSADPGLRRSLAARAAEVAAANYSQQAFERTVDSFCKYMEQRQGTR